MGKFKKGDRVRLVRDNMGFGDTGDTGEIVSPDAGDEDALVRFDREINGDHEWYAPWSRLELVHVAEADDPANSTAGFTVPLFDEDDFDICGHRDSDDDIVQLSVGELTAALANSLKVARKVGKTIKRGDLVTFARPALVTGVDRYHASVQTDGGNYTLPLAALTQAA